ncbi:MAG: LSU ribosomal protein L10p (P0) [uncultured Thermomicrobiales bacterium]|uniref:Large ribosomal subunit protein uL10 n=1 Tax=uncultured Thermomicrobiales bacterium TaxID=1645740 RepID=A0A6J4VPM7_9BACT|nr:MAG: LSU ribosomal protein L10p (P0) [uncultured Thermomicrobiales bacterium]
MPTKQKAATIDELADQLGRAQLTIVADYRGLGVGALESLRGNLRPINAEFRVAKNTLTTIAADRAGITGLDGLLAGPTALVLAYDDPVQASKVVTDFVRTSRVMTVRGGVMNNQLVTGADIDAIATLPSREELLARVVGMLASPMTRVVGVLSGPVRSLPYVLNARAEQLGGPQDEPIAAD